MQMLSSLKSLWYLRYGGISPSQVRYRAALRPDLPKRPDPVSLLGFLVQGVFGTNVEKSSSVVKLGARIHTKITRDVLKVFTHGRHPPTVMREEVMPDA